MKFISMMFVFLFNTALLTSVHATNLVIWHGSSSGGPSAKYSMVLKPYIEANSNFKVQFRFIPGDSGWTAVRQYLDQGTSSDTIHVIMQNDKISIARYLTNAMNSDELDKLKPVALLGRNMYILHADKDLSITKIEDLDLLNLNILSHGSVGPGSFGHLVESLLSAAIKTPINSITYPGGSKALADVVGGHISLYTGWPDSISSATQGLTTPIAVSHPVPELPNVATFAQQGITGIPTTAYWTLFAGPSVTSEQLQQLQQVFKKAFNDGDFMLGYKKRLNVSGAIGDPKKLDAWWRETNAIYSTMSRNPAFDNFRDQVSPKK